MLDDRKMKVLYAIINSYIVSAEPIGSRTISKEYDLGVSSATIRNEMSDLEDLGYLNKPHTSAGRIPSDKAYRMYVNHILKGQPLKTNEDEKIRIEQILARESKEIDELIQNSAKLLSAITNYTALAISPQLKESKLRHIQLVPIDDMEILVVLVSDSGIVKNAIFRVNHSIGANQLNTISNFFNAKLKGLTMEEISRAMESGIFEEIYELKEIINNIIPIIHKSLNDVDDVEVYSDGINNIFNFPEYKDVNKAKAFISFVEDKDLLIDLMLNESFENGVEITIGNENDYDQLKDCSLITTTYKFKNMTIGKLGIIGPTRMDYSKVINTLKSFSVNLTEVFNILMKES